MDESPVVSCKLGNTGLVHSRSYNGWVTKAIVLLTQYFLV